ncbi:MAG: hypothetical protein V4850_20780 [Myxococcota bacterium]
MGTWALFALLVGVFYVVLAPTSAEPTARMTAPVRISELALELDRAISRLPNTDVVDEAALIEIAGTLVDSRREFRSMRVERRCTEGVWAYSISLALAERDGGQVLDLDGPVSSGGDGRACSADASPAG